MLLSEAGAETGARPPGLGQLHVVAGLNHRDAPVPVGRPHVVAVVHQQFVFYQDPSGVLQFVVLLLVVPLQVVHMEQDYLYGRGDFPLLLNGSKLLRGGGDSLERLGQHRHLLLQAPQQLPGVGLLAHPVQALDGGLQLSDLVLSVPLCSSE